MPRHAVLAMKVGRYTPALVQPRRGPEDAATRPVARFWHTAASTSAKARKLLAVAALAWPLLSVGTYGQQPGPAVAQAVDPGSGVAKHAPPGAAAGAPAGEAAADATPDGAASPTRRDAGPAAAGPSGESPTTDGSQAAPDDLLGLILAGGPLNIVFMSVLGLFSLAAVAIALERLVQTGRKRLLPPPLLTGLDELIKRGELHPQAYQDLCRSHPSPLASVLQAGLARLGRPANEIEKAMEDTLAREVSQLRARIRPLSVIGSVAPLVGLLGTVVGMLEAFRTASTAGLGKAELLAKGIYLALETTVAGLAIAIPAMLAAAWFQARIERAMFVIDERMMETLPLIPRMQQTAAERPGSRAAHNPLLSTRS